MTYLNWGCDPLADECQSCLDALCNACVDEFSGEPGRGDSGPDCDRCDLERKPSCSCCEIILAVCKNCPEHKACSFKITG